MAKISLRGNASEPSRRGVTAARRRMDYAKRRSDRIAAPGARVRKRANGEISVEHRRQALRAAVSA